MLLLDEPTAGLDAATEAQVLASVRALAGQGRLVLMVAHRPAVLEAADRVVALPVPAGIPAASWERTREHRRERRCDRHDPGPRRRQAAGPRRGGGCRRQPGRHRTDRHVGLADIPGVAAAAGAQPDDRRGRGAGLRARPQRVPVPGAAGQSRRRAPGPGHDAGHGVPSPGAARPGRAARVPLGRPGEPAGRRRGRHRRPVAAGPAAVRDSGGRGRGTVCFIALLLPSAALVLAVSLVAAAVVAPWAAGSAARQAERRIHRAAASWLSPRSTCCAAARNCSPSAPPRPALTVPPPPTAPSARPKAAAPSGGASPRRSPRWPRGRRSGRAWCSGCPRSVPGRFREWPSPCSC